MGTVCESLGAGLKRSGPTAPHARCFLCGNAFKITGLPAHWKTQRKCADKWERGVLRERHDAVFGATPGSGPAAPRVDDADAPTAQAEHLRFASELASSSTPASFPRIDIVRSLPQGMRLRVTTALRPLLQVLHDDPHDVPHNVAWYMFARWVLRRDTVAASARRGGRRKAVRRVRRPGQAAKDNMGDRIARFARHDWEGLHEDYLRLASVRAPRKVSIVVMRQEAAMHFLSWNMPGRGMTALMRWWSATATSPLRSSSPCILPLARSPRRRAPGLATSSRQSRQCRLTTPPCCGQCVRRLGSRRPGHPAGATATWRTSCWRMRPC